MNLGIALREIRMKRKVHIKDFADRVGSNVDLIKSIERSETPHKEKLRMYCQELEVSEATILLYAIKEEQLPEFYREDFKSLKKQILK